MSTQFSKAVYDAVLAYREWDSDGKQYVLTVHDLPQTEIDTLTSILLSDPMNASEAIGADNDAWEGTILPAIQSLLKNRFCDDRRDHTDAILSGITSYFYSAINREIERQLSMLNSLNGFYGDEYLKEAAQCMENTAQTTKSTGVMI